MELGGLLSEGRQPEAAEVYRRAISHDRYSEGAHRGLMRCYARMGERGKAIEHYRSLVESLREELGSAPAPETVELHRRLREGEDI
jgi:DNA-binding SARP family transcriptional activator